MAAVRIGVLGFGTVGSGVVDVLLHRGRLIADRSGVDLELAGVADSDLARVRDVKLDRTLLVADAWKLIRDPGIPVIVELVGGVEAAREYVLGALREGKHVVTANKALLAQSGQELFREAMRRGVQVRFEASVGGGIPIIKAIRESLIVNRIQAILGIINGTTNYILSQMTERKVSFGDALCCAQEAGFAERDPSLDVDGLDSAHKLALLASFASGAWVDIQDIAVEGIREITVTDVLYAEQLGYRIKLLAVFNASQEGDPEVRVYPVLLPVDHVLSSVSGAFNAIHVTGDIVGEGLYYGLGAGRNPTASAVVSDIVDVARSIECPRISSSPGLDCERAVHVREPGQLKTRAYLRVTAVDRPGVLAQIAGVLGAHHISIASVMQLERCEGEGVPVVMMTHVACEKDLVASLHDLDRISVVCGRTQMIRVLGQEEDRK